MIGLARMSRDRDVETLTLARAVRLANAQDKDYRSEMDKAEKLLNG